MLVFERERNSEFHLAAAAFCRGSLSLLLLLMPVLSLSEDVSAERAETSAYYCELVAGNDTQLGLEPGPSLQSLVDANQPIEVGAREMLLQADSAIYDGEVDVRRGPVHLRAGRASLDLESSDIQLLGDVSITMPGAELKGDSASINLETNASIINGAQYFVKASPGISGSAGSVELDEQQKLTVLDGSYTRCDPSSKEWEVAARKIVLDSVKGQGTAEGALIRIFDRPIVYIPYMRFPVGNKRQSGLLFPEIASRSEGIDFAVPYYFNLAPNYDLLLTPRYRAGHGYITGLKTRWLNPFDRWEASTIFIDSDESRRGDSRWSLQLDEKSEWSGDIVTQLSISRVSDRDVPRDLQSNDFAITRSSSLLRTGRVEWLHRFGTVGVAVEQFQSIDPDLSVSNEKQPEIWTNLFVPGRRGLPDASANLRYTAFEKVDLGLTTPDDKVERSAGQLSLQYPLRVSGSTFTFGAGNEFRYYKLERPSVGLLNGQTRDWVNVLHGSAGWTIDLWRNNASSGSIQELLKPELSYTWRQIESGADSVLQLPSLDGFLASSSVDSLFAESNLGGDFIETRDQARIALSYQRYGSKSGESVSGEMLQSVFSAIVGTTQQFSQQLPAGAGEVLRAREWFTDIDWYLGGDWRAISSLVWSEEQSRFSLASAAFRYHPDTTLARKPVINVGYHRRADQARFAGEEPLEQIDLSAAYPIDNTWSLYGRFLYDQENQLHSEALAGFEFNDCCFKLRLVYRDGLVYRPSSSKATRDRAVMLQIQLKGLGGVGDGLVDLLESSIRGFESR